VETESKSAIARKGGRVKTYCYLHKQGCVFIYIRP